VQVGIISEILSVDVTQGLDGNPQVVEEAENHLPKPAKTELVWKMQPQRRRYIQDCKFLVVRVLS